MYGGYALLVEGNRLDQELIAHTLKTSGYVHDVVAVGSGEDALRLLFTECRDVAAPTALPRMVLLDLCQPDAHGEEVLRRVREDALTKGLPVVALTNPKSPGDAERCLRLGCSESVVKPGKSEELLETVRGLAQRWAATADVPAQRSAQVLPVNAKRRAARVLLVDDSPETLAITKLSLTAWGCAVTIAHDGEEALEMIQAGCQPDVILLDWLMPLVSGIEVLRRVRELPLSTRPYVIMVTAKRGREDMREGCAAGADDYMLKPIVPARLRARLTQALQVLAARRAVAQASGG